MERLSLAAGSMTRLWPHGDPVQVTLGEDGIPRSFLWRGRPYVVAGVSLRWRVRTGWWAASSADEAAGEAWREYVKLTTVEGVLCTLYRDLSTDRWFCARLYD